MCKRGEKNETEEYLTKELSEENGIFIYTGRKRFGYIDFLLETLEAKRQQRTIFKVQKEGRKCQRELYTQQKYSSKRKTKQRYFHVKGNWIINCQQT